MTRNEGVPELMNGGCHKMSRNEGPETHEMGGFIFWHLVGTVSVPEGYDERIVGTS